MVTLMSKDNRESIISLSKGEMFFADFMIPEGIEKLATVEQLKTGSTKIVTTADVVAVVEGLHLSKKGCKHIRFARFAREESQIRVLKTMIWPKLRLALHNAGVERSHQQGGFHEVIGYGDEIAVADYGLSGSHGWIIRRQKIRSLLVALPKIQNSGIIAR